MDDKIMNQEENKPIKQDGGETRREFLKKSTIAAAAVAASANIFKTPVYGQDQAPSTGNVVGANRPPSSRLHRHRRTGHGACEHSERQRRRQ